MVLLSLSIVVVIIAFSIGRLNRLLQQRRQGQQLSAPASDPLNRLRAWFNAAMLELQRKPDTERLGAQFRAWVASALGNETELQAWLLALSSEQIQALVEHVAVHCKELKVQLTWLTEQQIEVPLALKSTAQEIVVDYCTGIWKATKIKAKLQLFSEYQQFTQPTTEQQQQLLQRDLLARLAAQELVASQSLAATLTGTPAEQQAKVVQTIQQVATKDWERFVAVFQPTVRPNGLHGE